MDRFRIRALCFAIVVACANGAVVNAQETSGFADRKAPRFEYHTVSITDLAAKALRKAFDEHKEELKKEGVPIKSADDPETQYGLISRYSNEMQQEVDRQINLLGDKGWELVTSVSNNSGGPHLIFKRPK
jgi:hypothetical protein